MLAANSRAPGLKTARPHRTVTTVFLSCLTSGQGRGHGLNLLEDWPCSEQLHRDDGTQASEAGRGGSPARNR